MTTDHTTAVLPTIHDLPILMTIAEVAAHLGVTVRHVRRLVAERRIPYIKWGHLLRFDPIQLAQWLADQHKPVTDPSSTDRGASGRRKSGASSDEVGVDTGTIAAVGLERSKAS